MLQRLFLGVVALACLLLLGRPAAADKGLLLEAAPVLGPSVPSGAAWFSVSVRVDNTTDAQIEGNLELTAELSFSREEAKVLTRAPFAVAGKGKVTVFLPIHGFSRTPPMLRVRAVHTAGTELADLQLSEPRTPEPLLFDLSVSSRVGAGLRGMKVPVGYPSYSRGGYGPPVLTVATPAVNAATGEPVLPERAAGYAAATVVLAKSEQIARLKGPELEALSSWVLSGGSLGVVITRPEDLRNATLKAFVGGEIATAAPAAEMKNKRVFTIVEESTSGSGSYPSYGAGRIVGKELAPSEETVTGLVGYRGGNLRPSPWGASASYGLGEIHLLAFDTNAEKAASDEWVQLEVLDLVRQSWTRDSTVALPHGRVPLDEPEVRNVRKELDPNEGARWAIVVALLILLGYAVLAGPVNFHLATKKGHPLRALRHLPIWAGGTMALIVVLGAAAKGFVGRVRHLSMIEVGAGMPRGAITRFRGFYASSAGELLVRATERGSVLDVAGPTDDTGRVIVVDRDGARIEQLQSKPWQTVVVREDGFVGLGGGISVVDKGGDVEVKNRAARDLVAVLVKVPAGDAYFFPRIADGDSVRATAGEKLGKKLGRVRVTAGGGRSHQLDASLFSQKVDSAARGAGAAWTALSFVADNDTDWWPDDVPVVLAQLEGGEGRSSDSGLRMDIDRVLVRVVGYGGVP